MTSNLYHLRIPPDLARAAQHLAAQRHTTVGQMLRALLAAEVAGAKTDSQDTSEISARDKVQMTALFDGARNWADLSDKLLKQGFALKPAGNGLALHRTADDHRLCKTGTFGQTYAKLVQRFGEPFPDHPHAWLAKRMLTTPAVPAPAARLNQVITDHRRSPASVDGSSG